MADFSECFASASELHCFEVYRLDGVAELRCHSSLLRDDEVVAGVRSIGQREPNAIESLVIMFSEGHWASFDDDHTVIPHAQTKILLPVRVRSEHYEALAEAFGIPTSFLKMTIEGQTVFVKDQITKNCNRRKGVAPWFSLQTTTLKSSRFSMTTSYVASRRQTRIFIHGLKLPDIGTLMANIKTDEGLVGIPTLTASLLLRRIVHNATVQLTQCHIDIQKIERRTAIVPHWHPDSPCCIQDAKQASGRSCLEAIDVDTATDEATSLLTRLAYIEFLAEVHAPMLAALDTMSKRLVDGNNTDEDLQDAGEVMHGRMEFDGSTLTGVLPRTQYFTKRGQAQMHTIFSLVAQKGDLLAMRENAELKSISRNQEQLAQAATRDSTAMTVIAAVTMFFLPGTFTATLFSTTFFDFRLSNNENIVSSWLWLYFATTIGLSLITFTLWRVWLRRALSTRKPADNVIKA